MLSVHTVVFPTDDSSAAETARPLAERLATHYRAALHVLRVEVFLPLDDIGYDPATDPLSVTPAVSTPWGSVVEVRRRAASAADAILAYADEVEASLVVMGTHGHAGFNRLVLGSTAEHVLRRAPCPVLTVSLEGCSQDAADLDGPVLAPLDFDSASDVVLETAAALAEDQGRRLAALHVVEPIEVPIPYMMALPPIGEAEIESRVQPTLARWVAPYISEGVPIATEIRFGRAVGGILDTARQLGAGFIVQSSHGRRGVGRWLLGSIAEAVVRRAPCPVLTLRMGARGLLAPEKGAKAQTYPVSRAEWGDLFDALSSHVVSAHVEGTSYAITVEILTPDAEGLVFDAVPLTSLTYDPDDDAVEVMTESGEHHVVRPFSVRSSSAAWALATDGPAPWSLVVVRSDGTRESLSAQPLSDAVLDAPSS